MGWSEADGVPWVEWVRSNWSEGGVGLMELIRPSALGEMSWMEYVYLYVDRGISRVTLLGICVGEGCPAALHIPCC